MVKLRSVQVRDFLSLYDRFLENRFSLVGTGKKRQVSTDLLAPSSGSAQGAIQLRCPVNVWSPSCCGDVFVSVKVVRSGCKNQERGLSAPRRGILSKKGGRKRRKKAVSFDTEVQTD